MTQTRGRWAFDVEAQGLVDHTTVDYTQSPYRLKAEFLTTFIHCVCFLDVDTNQTVDFVRTDYPTFEAFRDAVLAFIANNVLVLISQNGLDYDLLVLKICLNIDYFVAGDPSEQDMFNGKPIVFRDTLVMSKLLNSERYGGHSLESWGEEFGFPKIDWRAKAIELGLITKSDPKGAEFRVYHPEMLVYCRTDVAITARLFLHLEKEMAGWNWLSSLLLEQFIRDNITKQSHRGFLFNSEAAHGYLDDLDTKMQTIEEKVLPLLPDKPLTKGDLDSWTPPVRQLVYAIVPEPPKQQVKKDGTPTQHMLNYAAKLGGTIEGDYDIFLNLVIDGVSHSFSSTVPLNYWAVFEQVSRNNPPTLSTNIENWVQKHDGFLYFADDNWFANIEGQDYVLPLECKPLKTHKRPSLKDSIHLKQWLVTKGWIPTEWKEKDLTINTRKQKLTPEQFASTIQRYIEQTLESPFKPFRFEQLQVRTNQQFINKLQNHNLDRPLKVITNPNLTIGQSKEIDPSLLRLSDTFPYAADVSHYLTYNHRRNSIVGGGYQFDEDNDDEPETGFLSHGRLEQDGRLPTPADTQGAASGRFRHKFIVNLARNTSLYGAELRSLFGVDVERYSLLGFDFSSLEARVEGHYTYRYDDSNKSYVNSLLGERPNDVHTLTAKKIASILQREFARQDAKSVKYACSYGAMPKKVAKTIGASEEVGKLVHEAFWSAALPLAELKKNLERYWETIGQKKFILGLDGRKIPTRSKSALINYLFQSAGVICTKRAAWFHDRMLRARGLICDFWVDDWRTKSYAQQLIHYHDEAQIEITKDLVETRLFPVTKWEYKDDKPFSSTVLQQIKDFCAENPNWSSAHQTSEGYVLSYSIVGDLALQAVAQAGQYYKLNVPLTAEYAVGSCWRDCH
jgi:hypothetical protein